jgi:DNA-binding beta-propeller fold protein YncE
VAISRSGKFAYVINNNSANVSVFAINASTGALTQVKGSPHRTRPFPTSVAIDPTSKFVYMTHEGFYGYSNPGHVAGYAINTRSGALRRLEHTRKLTGFAPVSAAIDPAGKFLYVANYASETVSAYAITAGTGALNEVRGSPFFTGYNPGGVAIDPKGSFAYVVFDLEVAGYKIEPNGALTPVQGSPFAGGYEPDGVAIDPRGKFAYVSSTGPNGAVSAYAINPRNGALTLVQGSPFAAGDNPAAIATCEIEHDICVPRTL